MKFNCSGPAAKKGQTVVLWFRDEGQSCPGEDDWGWGVRSSSLASSVQAIDAADCEEAVCEGGVGGIADFPVDMEAAGSGGGAFTRGNVLLAASGGFALVVMGAAWYARRRYRAG